jgi:hypothetical protein
MCYLFSVTQQIFDRVLLQSLEGGSAVQISESLLLEALSLKPVFGKAGDVSLDPSGAPAPPCCISLGPRTRSELRLRHQAQA